MKTNGKTVKGSVRAVLRAVADSLCSPVWAVNMPSNGGGNLATGQAGAAGQPAGPYIAQAKRDMNKQPDPALAADWDYALMPLRQF